MECEDTSMLVWMSAPTTGNNTDPLYLQWGLKAFSVCRPLLRTFYNGGVVESSMKALLYAGVC